MGEKRMLEKIVSRLARAGDRGSALIMSLVALAILAVTVTAFSVMVTSETHSINSMVMTQKSLFVAESGIEDVLFQRSKMPDQMCYPFTYYDPAVPTTDPDATFEILADNIEIVTGARPGRDGAAPDRLCDPEHDSDPSTQPAVDELPCWPYNERLYANKWVFPADNELNDGFLCNDGSDGPDGDNTCPYYRPLMYWPADDSGTKPGWKDMKDSVDAPLGGTNGTGTGARYSTGFFTICGDDYKGIQSSDTNAWSHACSEAKQSSAQPCPRKVFSLSVVSVGEVQVGKKAIRRAVKVDMLPAALYAGVIDKYVNIALTYQTNINGPIHINGYWNNNKWMAISYKILGLSLGLSAAVMGLDPPELISVSYPEPPEGDPTTFDGIPLIGGKEILWVHLPVRIEIPQVNWAKWEDRMQELYDQALDDYSGNPGAVETLYRCNFKTQNPPAGNYKDYWNTLGDCGDSGEQYPYDSGGSRSDDKLDAGLPKFMSSMSPSPSPYNTGAGRIHNLERYKSDAEVWGSSSKFIFDLFDHWDYFPEDWVSGPEPGAVALVSGSPQDPGPRDRSFRFKRRFILSPDFGLGCLTCVIGNGISFDSFMFCCIGKQLNRNEFWFMGKHEFRDFVYIDGVMGIGYRTPYHTCGGGDGGLGVYCIVIPQICIFSLCIPSWKFGLPHWHLGGTTVKGEVLVNGRLYMADWIHIDGGTVYADGHIIKDEASGFDVILHLDTLICWILTGFMGPSITIDLGIIKINICDVVFAVLNPIIASFFPWWPDLDLTNNGLIDFETYLDIDGVGPDKNVVNPGTLYTRGDFRLLEPGWDIISFLGNALLGMFLPFLELTPSMDPIRIWNGGAIVAGGKPSSTGDPAYVDGNIYVAPHERGDILVYDPDSGSPGIGYALARGGLMVGGDIINDYGWGGLLDSCATTALESDLLDCAAAGIFYSGGIAAGTNPRNTYSRSGMGIGVPYGEFDEELSVECNANEDGFWDDPLASLGCWGGALMNVLGGDVNTHLITGHVFAGAIGAFPGAHLFIDQNSKVRSDAVKRQYFKQLGGTPLNWAEIDPPNNLDTVQ